MEEDPNIQRGRDQRSRQRAEQRAQLAAAGEKERSRRLNDPEQQHYFGAAGTRLGVLRSGDRMYVMLLFAFIGTAMLPGALEALFHFAAHAGFRQDLLAYYGTRIWPLFPFYLITGAAVLFIGRVAGARAGQRELAWLESLPFPVAGHLSAFGHGTWHQELKVSIAFPGQPMPKAELARLLGIFSPGVSIKEWSDELEFQVMHAGRPGPLARLFVTSGGRSSLPGMEYASNRALLLLFHDLAAEVLLPLHRIHPITSVKLDGG